MKQERLEKETRWHVLGAIMVAACVGSLFLAASSLEEAHAATTADYEQAKSSFIDTYNHGAIQITVTDAGGTTVAPGGTVELSVGETATITVTPYKHVQYRGCRMWDKPCPSVCDEMFEQYGMEGTCFEVGKGCICDPTPTLESADVATSVSGFASAVSVSSIQPVTNITAANAVGTTTDGTIKVTAVSPGECTVVVSADALYFWKDATPVSFNIEVV